MTGPPRLHCGHSVPSPPNKPLLKAQVSAEQCSWRTAQKAPGKKYKIMFYTLVLKGTLFSQQTSQICRKPQTVITGVGRDCGHSAPYSGPVLNRKVSQTFFSHIPGTYSCWFALFFSSLSLHTAARHLAALNYIQNEFIKVTDDNMQLEICFGGQRSLLDNHTKC